MSNVYILEPQTSGKVKKKAFKKYLIIDYIVDFTKNYSRRH